MQTIRLLQTTESDGALSLRIPLGRPSTQFEVLVVVQPCAPDRAVDAWPAGYFELAGSIDDETFLRHPQGKAPDPLALD